MTARLMSCVVGGFFWLNIGSRAQHLAQRYGDIGVNGIMEHFKYTPIDYGYCESS